MRVTAGVVDVTTYFVIRTAGDGGATIGATIADIDLQYCRSGVAPVAKVDATALVATDSDHADNKAIEIDATDQPGLYRIDWPDDAFAVGVREVVLTVKLAGSFTEHLRVELEGVDVGSISGDTTAADNLKLQYDTTGLNGDTFPATQAQVTGIANTGAAVHEPVVLSPDGFTLNTGVNEQNNEDVTRPLDGTEHQWDSTGNAMDGRYTFDLGGAAVPTELTILGRLNGAGGDEVQVNVNTGTVAAPVFTPATNQRGSIPRQGGNTNITRTFTLFTTDLMTGVDAGKVQIQIVNDGAVTGATFSVDQMFCSKSSIASQTGYQDGQIWVNTLTGTAGIVKDVNGVADKAVLTWADALTISSLGGFADDFHIINGSMITLTGNSDKFSLFGDNWILQLANRSVAGAYFQGARVSGISTSATEVHFEGCDVATMSVQIGHFDFCTFSGTVTLTLAGDYNWHDCKSMVAGQNGPTFAKTAGQVITAQWRGWKGSINLTGLEVGDTLTIGGDELGTIDLGSPAGAVVVEIRGIYKDLANVGSASVNLDGAINAADVALILGDTNELQGVLSAGILARSNNPTLNALLGVDDAASKTIGHTIWDKVLSKANHDIAQSAAKLLRQLASFVIANNDARVTGSPGINQIQLAASESSVDGTFDPGVVGIIDGTGAGQCRLVLEYDGPSRIATLNRDWKVAPDATSEYVILCSEGGLHVNEGLARGGGASSVTLNLLASASDRIYEGQFVFLVSGTGQDQVGRVTNYVGATRVATVETTMNGWVVQPDATTGYIMIPTLDIVPTLLGTPIALDGAAATIAAMLTKMADDNGGADFDATTDSQQAIRDRGDAAWVTGGTGTGARTVAVTVNDGAAVLENASVRFTEGVNTYAGLTNASGQISFSLDDATYTVAVSKAGYTFTPTTLVVDGDKSPTYSMTVVTITAPPNASTTTGVMTVYDEEGSVESGVTITVQIIDGPGTAGIGYDSTEWAETSSALGVVEFAGIILGAQYRIWRGTSKADVQTFTAPTTGTSFDLAEVIGRG